jgi:hypothetical protein
MRRLPDHETHLGAAVAGARRACADRKARVREIGLGLLQGGEVGTLHEDRQGAARGVVAEAAEPERLAMRLERRRDLPEEGQESAPRARLRQCPAQRGVEGQVRGDLRRQGRDRGAQIARSRLGDALESDGFGRNHCAVRREPDRKHRRQPAAGAGQAAGPGVAALEKVEACGRLGGAGRGQGGRARRHRFRQAAAKEQDLGLAGRAPEGLDRLQAGREARAVGAADQRAPADLAKRPAALGRDGQPERVRHEAQPLLQGARRPGVHLRPAHHRHKIFAGGQLRTDRDMHGVERLGDQVLDREARRREALALRGQRERHAQKSRVLARKGERVPAEPVRRVRDEREPRPARGRDRWAGSGRHGRLLALRAGTDTPRNLFKFQIVSSPHKIAERSEPTNADDLPCR